jgi:hypothetical protein
MKTTVEVLHDDGQYKEYSKGDKGYIDGYTTGADGRPYAVVVIKQRLVFISANCLKATGLLEDTQNIEGEVTIAVKPCDCMMQLGTCNGKDCTNKISIP